MKRSLTYLVVAAVSLGAASVALAGGSIVQGYGGQAGKIVKSASPHAAPVSSGGVLPFTGLDLSLIVGAAILLVLTGLVVRRAGRNRA